MRILPMLSNLAVKPIVIGDGFHWGSAGQSGGSLHHQEVYSYRNRLTHWLYIKTSGDISINLKKGTLGTITWGSFAGTLPVGGASASPSVPTGAGASGANISYALKAGSAVNYELVTVSTGEVRAKAVSLATTKTCTLIGTASRTGYTSKTSGDLHQLECGHSRYHHLGEL